MPRLFIGISLPNAYRKAFNPLISRLSTLTDASIKWSRPDTWHQTLKFLGETDEARIPPLKAALSAIDFTAFTVRAKGAGAFPEARRPKVLWLGLAEGGEPAAALAQAIEDALAAIGIPREKKRYRPHLTLGRVRRPAPGDWDNLLKAAEASVWPPFTATRFILWQSTLAPEGAIHTPLAEFPAQ